MLAAFCIVTSANPHPGSHSSPDNRWLGLYAQKLEDELIQAFVFFRSQGIEPLLIKGWAAKRYYPPDVTRFYTDLDLAVPDSLFDEASKMLSSDEGRRIAVDLHRELKHLDARPWSEIFTDSQLVKLNGCDIRIPSPEDHLRILAVHWLNDGGENKERLWDIYYAVANRPAGFSWDKCLGTVSVTRQQWVIAAIGLAHRYLGLDLSDLPFAEQARELPKWLTDTVEREWRTGIRHRSLHTCLREPREFVRQLRKRFPPNPLQATIEMEGSILNGWRLPYQIGTMKKRALPSLKGLAHTVIPRAR